MNSKTDMTTIEMEAVMIIIEDHLTIIDHRNLIKEIQGNRNFKIQEDKKASNRHRIHTIETNNDHSKKIKGRETEITISLHTTTKEENEKDQCTGTMTSSRITKTGKVVIAAIRTWTTLTE